MLVTLTPVNSSNLSNCEQIAIYLVGTLPMVLAARLRPEEATS